MIKKRLIQLLSKAKKYIVYQVLFQWFGLLCQILMVSQIARLMDLALQEMLTQDVVLQALGIVILAALVRFLCDRQASHMSYRASVDVKGTLREKIYAKLLRLGSSYREHTATSNVVQSAVEGVDQLETYFGRYLPQLFYSLLAPLTLFIVLAPKNLKAAGVLLIFVPLIPMSIVFVQKIAKRLLHKYWGAYEELGDNFLENLQGLTTLKIYQSDGDKAVEMDKESEHFRKITMKVLTMQLNSTSVMDIMAYGGAAVGMIVALQQYSAGAMTFGGAMTFILLASEFFIPMRVLGSFFHIAMNGMAASDRIFAFLDVEEPEDGTKKIPQPDMGIEIGIFNLGFSYEKERQILANLQLRIGAGQFVSIVGESGSGKSTIAGLLMGRNKNYTGSITVNGQELSTIREDSIFENITYLSHDSYLFKGTVRENLQLAGTGVADAEMIRILEKVNLWSFLAREKGLNTELQEGASNLSGGQKQRLALARALLHDSKMYILDEATSNIDPESEALILKVLHELKGDKTILFISHRLSNSDSADQIYYLEHGAIVEEGTREELLEHDGGFAKLYRMQKELEEYGGRGEKLDITSSLKTSDTVIEEHKDGEKEDASRRPALIIMLKLIGLVKPLLPVMLLAITLGVIGFVCAIFLTITASEILLAGTDTFHVSGCLSHFGIWILVGMAIARGLLHYGEQYCNHFIAFKLLAIIRHKVFAKLRQLTPAKLEGKDRGNLISIITSDIELLEVFYAHTISPMAIALIMSVIMVLFIGRHGVLPAVLAVGAYLIVGVVIPIWIGQRGGQKGLNYRNAVGDMNSYVLESLRGLDETLQYGFGEQKKQAIVERSNALGKLQKNLTELEADQRSMTNLAIAWFAYGLFFIMAMICTATGTLFFTDMIVVTVALMGSFGPVVALSNLSNNLNQTLASGERVLSLLEENPQVPEVSDGVDIHAFTGIDVENVTFGYADGEQILKDLSVQIAPGKIVGIHGRSGAGKSTLLKLLMRFWDVESGSIQISGWDIRQLNTTMLRDMESFMTQETYLFHDSISSNIAIAKPGSSLEEIQEAAKKASIHDFIMSLPKGYDTNVGELGGALSGGERQRIGLARAFLHDAPLILLDEPTSNLDALNEGVILKSIRQEMEQAQGKTVLIVSHRLSTLQFADELLEM